LYALLNRFEHAAGPANTADLRVRMVNYFKDYDGKEPDIKKYVHPSKGVTWALLVSEIPKLKKKNVTLTFKQQQTFNHGSYLKPFLLDLYNETHFEVFYADISPNLNELATKLGNTFKDNEIGKILSDTWGVPFQGNIVMIPNPFTQGSFGPSFGNTIYQVLGMRDGRDIKSYVHNMIHEGSHPIAKKILKPFSDKINAKKHLINKAMEHPKYPRAYSFWGTCFEEHLIRAVHIGLINPKMRANYNVERALERELNNNGMVFIKQFYNSLIKNAPIEKAVVDIIKKLN